jgi:hypothetical protein
VPLLSDEEYLSELYDLFADHGWAHALASQPPSEEDLSSLDPDVQRQLRAEFGDPRSALTGLQVSEIKRAALAMLGEEAQHVEAIPVGLLPTQELNASAVRTPRGGAVILLNNSVFWSLPFLFFCYAALDSWHTDEPLMKEIPDLAFADAILSLAAFCATGDLGHLREEPLIATLLTRSSNEEMIRNAVLMECFVLLHEYGHIVGGHLDPEQTTTLETRAGHPGVTTFRTRWDEEYEADAFAVAHMLRSGAGTLRPTDVAIWSGLLLNFFALVETVGASLPAAELPATHPPAAERWRRVAKLVDLESSPDAYAARFDYWFPRLAHWWAEERAPAEKGKRRGP